MSGSIVEWLEQQGLGHYAEAFVENAIDMDILPHLTDTDLSVLGLALGDRRRLQLAIGSLPGGDTEQQPESALSTDGASIDEAERRQLTVMFCDLADSTVLAQKMDPEILREMNRAFLDQCEECITQYKGFVARYMGDGILAYFGYPQAHEDDAERAILAGLQIADSMGNLNAEVSSGHDVKLGVRVGIATGLVVVGDIIGEGTAQETAVTGQTPNLAARLQQMASVNSVLVGPETHGLTQGGFRFIDRGKAEVKGFDEPIHIWEVESRLLATSRFEARKSGHMTPLVGRDEETAMLLRRWEMASSSEGQVVLVSGEAGIGKSRICDELQDRIQTAGMTRIIFQCSPHHTEDALYPVSAYFKQSLGMDQQLDDLFSNTGTERETLASVAITLGIPTGELLDNDNAGAEVHLDKVLEALATWIDSTTAGKTLLCLFEDIHWADPSTVELLNILVDRLETRDILLVMTFRPEFTAPWIGRPHVSLMVLNRLTHHQAGKVIAAQTGNNGLDDARLQEIASRADGVPLFIEELTHAFLEAEEEGGVTLPSTLRDALMSRLDRLEHGKDVAQCSSSIGREFTHELVAMVSGLDPDKLEQGLNELVDTGLLIRRGSGSSTSYTFKHSLFQDAAYDSMLKAKRRELHKSIARALAEDTPGQDALIAQHWEKGGDLEQALMSRLAAAEQSAKISAISESVAHYRAALSLLEKFTRDREWEERFLNTILELLHVKSTYWETESEEVDSLARIDKGMRIAEQKGDHAAMAILKSVKGATIADEALLSESVVHARESGDVAIQSLVARSFSSFYGMRGQYEDSYVHTARAIELCQKIGEPVGLGWAMGGSGRCFAARAGRLETAIRYADQARKIATETGDPVLTAWATMATEPLYYSGLWQQALDILEAYLPAAYEHEQWDVVLWTTSWGAIAAVKLGELGLAESLVSKARNEVDRKIAYFSPRVFNRLAYAAIYSARRNFGEALNNARQALEFCNAGDDIPLEVGAAYRVAGQVHAAMGNPKDAQIHFDKSLSTLEQIQSRPELAQTLLAYGQYSTQYQMYNGSELVKRSMDMFKDMGAVGWAEEASNYLAQAEAHAH